MCRKSHLLYYRNIMKQKTYAHYIVALQKKQEYTYVLISKGSLSGSFKFSLKNQVSASATPTQPTTSACWLWEDGVTWLSFIRVNQDSEPNINIWWAIDGAYFETRRRGRAHKHKSLEIPSITNNDGTLCRSKYFCCKSIHCSRSFTRHDNSLWTIA